jgi:hypothetical protein
LWQSPKDAIVVGVFILMHSGTHGRFCQWQQRGTATKRATAIAMRVESSKEGNGNDGKSNGNGIKGRRQLTATRAMEMRVVDEQWQGGQWQWQQQWRQ